MHAAAVCHCSPHGWAMWDTAVLISSTCEKWRNVLREQKVHIPTGSFCVSSLLEQKKWVIIPASLWGCQEGVNTRGCVSIGCALHIKSNIYEWRSDVPLQEAVPKLFTKYSLEKNTARLSYRLTCLMCQKCDGVVCASLSVGFSPAPRSSLGCY